MYDLFNFLELSKNTVTIIPLATTYCHAPYISDEILTVIRNSKKCNKTTLLFFSRRGNSRAWICQDCGFFERCPHCDIALAYHSSPKKKLMCHQCRYTKHVDPICSYCQGSHFLPVGVGIQKIYDDLSRILGDSYLLGRIDSDSSDILDTILANIQGYDVLITTSISHFLDNSNINAIVFLCFELNLAVPEYNFEERLFGEIAYHKKKNIPMYIQTYTPSHPLLNIITSGNFQSFLSYTLNERKYFQYPPFSDFVTIRIHDIKKERTHDMLLRIMNKITMIRKNSTVMSVNPDIYDRYGGEWIQTIILRDTSLDYLISQLEKEIVRNRAVTLERD